MRVVIVGATSAIAQEVAKLYACDGVSLLLVARNEAKLSAVARDLRARGAVVETMLADLAGRSRDEAIAEAAGAPDVVLIAHGALPDQRAIDGDAIAQVSSFTLNASSVIALAARLGNVIAPGGALAVIGSVAGDRGRRGNYVYGAAKAAVHAYCEGLRGHLAGRNVAVVLIKPGWVDTPMTAAMKKNLLFASPQRAARCIRDAIGARRAIAYVPGFWRWISLVMRMMPRRVVRFLGR